MYYHIDIITNGSLGEPVGTTEVKMSRPASIRLTGVENKKQEMISLTKAAHIRDHNGDCPYQGEILFNTVPPPPSPSCDPELVTAAGVDFLHFTNTFQCRCSRKFLYINFMVLLPRRV